MHAGCSTACAASRSRNSNPTTWCAIPWCRRSSMRTTAATRRRSGEVRRQGPSLIIQRAPRAAHIPGDASLRKWANAAGVRGAVTVRYVGAAESRRLNREYRRKDYAANVLSFPYSAKPVEGDLVICAPVVAREAREQG